jgi:biotin carboxylase
MSVTPVTPRILIIDGHGSHSPADYVRSLSPLAELRTVCLTPPSPKDAREKERALSAAGELTVVGQPQEVPDAAIRVARSWRPDGLFAQSESILREAAHAAERLGLPFHSPYTADLLRRKDLQRAALRSAGMPCPRTAVLDDDTDLWTALAHVGLPAVLKPVTGNGSISTMLIESKEGLPVAREEAARHYRADPRMYGQEPVFQLESLLVGERWHTDERYGDHVSVESLVFEGQIHHLAVTDKLPLAPPFRETGDIMPSTLPAAQQRLLFDAAADAIRALGIRIGAVHTELKLTAEGPRVIEVNGRVGGGVPRLLGLCAGYDVLADIGRLAIGTPPLANPRFNGFALFLTPVSPMGDVVVREVRGEAQARALSGVADLAIRYPAGSRPDWRMGGTTSLYRAYVTSETAEGLFEVAERIRRTIKIELEDAG